MVDYDKLLKSIPEGLNQIEIARFLYIELGKYFIYDDEFVSSEDMNQRQAIARKNIDDITDNKVVCFSLSRIYTELLKRCGIKAETIYTPAYPNNPKDIGHACTKININGKIGFPSLIIDLTNIKVGFKTEHFLQEPTKEQKNTAKEKGMLEENETLLTLDEESLRKIDQKIGYTYNRDVFE